MEEENNDYLKLSVEERCQHKLWKARLSGYDEAAKLFQLQTDDKSQEFNKYLGLLKNMVIDSNAIAQERGLLAVLAFVQNAAVASKAVGSVMTGLITKCFSSPRAKTRELALGIALMYIEIEKQEVVLEELMKGLENKSPKIVSACLMAIRTSLHSFGSQVVSIKPIMVTLLKLFEDRDKSVREESKQLCVEIYRWVNNAIKPLLQNLKPVTLSELENEFQKTQEEKKTVPTRYLKSQQEKLAKLKENADAEVEEAAAETSAALPVIDPFDVMTSVDVLSKLPKNFYEQCEAKKWQERKEVLEILINLTTNVKLESGDYGDLVRILKKLITKDSNIVVVALAVKCLCNLVLGLRKKFQPYTSACVPAIFEKFKEKKQNVVMALREAIDALFNISNFDAFLEDIQNALENKNPQVKAETCAFLTRCFAISTQASLNKKLLKSFSTCLLKTINDTDSVVRENSAEALGTAMRVVGEKTMLNFLADIDAIKKGKIKDFCDKAVITAQPAAPTADKKPSSAPPKPAPKAEDPPKPNVGAIKKPASAGALKPKSAPTAARSTKPPSKKASSIVTEPEFKEQELSEEDVLAQAAEILPDDVINGLCSSNWKDRLASVEKFLETIQQLPSGSLPAQILIKLLAKKPGFKENNFQILKLRFDILMHITENGQISQISVDTCLSDIVDKIGDAKNGPHAGSALTSLARSTSLEYLSLEVLNLAFNQKNPKNQSETLIWLSATIKQFGFKIQIKETIDYLKKAFSSTNPGVRNAALALVGTMFIYVGKPLRSFFEGEKSSLLQQIDSECEKVKDIKPPVPEKGKSLDSNNPAPNSGEKVNLADLMPRTDISGLVTSQLLSDLADKDWHLRSDSLQKISSIITDAKYVTPNLGDLPSALKLRLVDTNKRLALQALNICQILGEALGTHCPKQIRNFAPGILSALGDNKANVRAAGVQCLNSWMDHCSLANLFEAETVFDALKADNPLLRIELFSWLTEKMPAASSLPSAELNMCVPTLLACLEDRNPDVRKKAAECVLPFMIHVGYEPMARAASKLKPASKATVVTQLDKARQSLPAKATANTKSRQVKTPSATLNERSSPPNVTNDADNKSKLNRSISKSKLNLKAPAAVSKSKKEEEADTSPPLVENGMKEQRISDEKALKVLKWNFTNPREEFYVQLKDQMIAANWGKTLISHCFHNDFKFHIKAIDILIESVKTNVEASAANLDLILKWLALRFFDTNPSVMLKSLEYLQILFQSLLGISYRMLEPEASSFVPYLILKIGDPKDPVRKGVREIINSISRVYPYSKMFSYIMQGLSSKNARQRAECLEELCGMIEAYGLNVCQPSPAAALKEIARQISDRDNSVRTAALNCVVQAYFIEGEKVYKYVGNLSDKDMSLLEERIKRCAKTKSIKPSESVLQTPKATHVSHLNSTFASEETKVSPVSLNQSTKGRLRMETQDIEEMFKHKEPSQVPDFVQVNADDILNLPDIKLPRTRLRPPVSSLKMLNNSSEAATAVNLVMAQLAAQDIPVVIQAMSQVEEVLKVSDEAVEILESRVDQLLVMGSMQYRYAHNKHMADENICKADVVSLYRAVTATLVTLFDNPVLAKKASRDVLRDLIPHLITVMLDSRLDDFQEGAQVVKVINVLILRVLQKSNPTNVLSSLIKLLHDSVGSVNISERFTDLVMKCLWKMIRMIKLMINDLDIDRILADIHVFFKAYPTSSWKERSDDTPVRTIKTILFKLVEIKNEDIMKHLSLISDRQESDLVTYLKRLLARKKDDNRKSLNKNLTLEDKDSNNRHNRSRSSPLKLSKSSHEALTDIFRKIGSKETSQEGLLELYEFTLSHPEADIEPYLKTSTKFFQDYIRQGMDKMKKERVSSTQSPLVPSKETSSEWNSNFTSGKSATFVRGKMSWEGYFPPVPPYPVDTTPMDLVDWLKNVVAILGMDTSKYDDPSFLERITGNGNSGRMSDEEMTKMYSDIEKYKKILEDLRNVS